MAKKHPIQKQGIIKEELNFFQQNGSGKPLTGFVKRERRIDPTLMFWVLVLGFVYRFRKENPCKSTTYLRIKRCTSRQLLRTLHARTCEVSSGVLHGLENIAQGPGRLKEVRRIRDEAGGKRPVKKEDDVITTNLRPLSEDSRKISQRHFLYPERKEGKFCCEIQGEDRKRGL